MFLVVLCMLAGVAVGAATAHRLPPLLARLHRQNRIDGAGEAAYAAARQDGASYEEAEAAERTATERAATEEAMPDPAAVVRRPWLLAAGMAAVTGGLLAVFAARVPAGALPMLAALAVLGVALTVVDARTLYLPDVLVFPAAVLVALLLPFAPHPAWGRVLASAGLWLLVLGLPWLITGGRGVGFGDVKLAPVLGAALGYLGWGPSLVGLFAGLVLGVLVGGALALVARAGWRARLPYGPYMLAGAVVGVLAGGAVWHALLAAYGLT